MRHLLVVPALLLALTACSGAEPEASAPAGEPAASASGPSESTAPSPEPEADEEPSPAAAPVDQVLASREGTLGRSQARADVITLRRAGELVNLEVVLTNVSDGTLVAKDLFEATPGDGAVTGITLVDGVASKRYLPAKDSAGNCVCSEPGQVVLPSQGSTVISATYAAPPDSTELLSVELPGFGTFTDLALAG